MELSERIKMARFMAGYRGRGSAARFCRDAGLRDNTLWCYENGRYKPSAEKLAAIAKTAGADLAWLITGEEPSKEKE